MVKIGTSVTSRILPGLCSEIGPRSNRVFDGQICLAGSNILKSKMQAFGLAEFQVSWPAEIGLPPIYFVRTRPEL